jgi:hypothetical protein
LLKKIKNIIDTMKIHYIGELLGVKGFALRYHNEKPFPDLAEHDVTDKDDERVLKFTIAIYSVLKHLSDDVLDDIIAKSPLEFVPLLREIETFLLFVSANPRDFGHGTLLDKRGEKAVVYASQEALRRIMKVCLYRNLLAPNDSHIHRLSRISSAFYRYSGTKNPDEIIRECIEGLKRNPADDARVPIYYGVDILDFPDAGTILDFMNHSTTMPVLPLDADFDTVKNAYIVTITKAQKEVDTARREASLAQALSLAKQLCGIGILKQEVYKPLEGLCLELDTLSETNLKESDEKAGKAALKLKRLSESYSLIAKFIRIASRLHQAMNADISVLGKLMVKDPDSVIHIAKEFVLMLEVLACVLASESKPASKTEEVYRMMRDFSKASDEGTYLLSIPVSVAMSNDKEFNSSDLIESCDFSDKSAMLYLKIF